MPDRFKEHAAAALLRQKRTGSVHKWKFLRDPGNRHTVPGKIQAGVIRNLKVTYICVT